MFGKKRKELKKLSNEEKKIILDEYGTTDIKEIEKMLVALHEYRIKLRCESLDLKFNHKLTPKEHMMYVELIINMKRIVERERIILKMSYGSNKTTISEEFINDLDKFILFNQMAKKGYSDEKSEVIYTSINKKYRMHSGGLLSIDLDDYNMDETLDVKIKPVKERYKNMLLKQEKNKYLEM